MAKNAIFAVNNKILNKLRSGVYVLVHDRAICEKSALVTQRAHFLEFFTGWLCEASLYYSTQFAGHALWK